MRRASIWIAFGTLVCACFDPTQAIGLPPLQMEPAPRLRGAQVIEAANWDDPRDPVWQAVSDLPNWGANATRILVQPYDRGSAVLPGRPLQLRIAENAKRFETLIEWLLARHVHVILAINLYYGWPPPAADWPDDGRSLWKDASAQDELVEAWKVLAQKYRGRPGLIFNLLSEPHGIAPDEIDGDHALPKRVWNQLYPRIVRAIEAIDRERWMVIEPIWANAANFGDLLADSSPRLIYSFHDYAPHWFTHQGVGSNPPAGTVQYPGITADGPWQPEKWWDKAAKAQAMQPAVAFQQRTGARIMCGEYATTGDAPMESRVRWTADVLDLCEGFGFDTNYFGYWPGVLGSWSFEKTPIESSVTSHLALNSAVPRNPPGRPRVALEYYHPGLDHFFVTSIPGEIEKLDAGVFSGWSRTGAWFGVHDIGTGSGADVCRFFSTAFAPKSSHFYTADAAECQQVRANPDWNFEGLVFAMRTPDLSGTCANAWPLFRLYNDGQGGAPNHRYTTSAGLRTTMIAKGWRPEGAGALGVAGCVPR